MYNCLFFNNIEEEFFNKKNSHSYIFYSNNFEYCKEDVYKLIRKIFSVDNINLISTDFLVIASSDKKNILKEDVSELRSFFQKTTYVNNKRLYLIEEAHKLNTTSANLILKFLEEPLDGVIAFFITTNLDAVLPTIKSRCQVINCFYDINENCNDNFDDNYNKMFVNDKYVKLFTLDKDFSKIERSELIKLFTDYVKYYYENFDKKYKNRISNINRAIKMLNNNVNIDYVIDYLCIKGDDKV